MINFKQPEFGIHICYSSELKDAKKRENYIMHINMATVLECELF